MYVTIRLILWIFAQVLLLNSRYDHYGVSARLLWSHVPVTCYMTQCYTVTYKKHMCFNRRLKYSAQVTGGFRVIRIPLCLQTSTYVDKHKYKCSLVTGGFKSPCSPLTLPPLPSLIHPHRGPECLLSLSSPALPPLFQGPVFPFVRPSGFWGRRFFWGCKAFSIAACSAKLKRVLVGSRC